MSVRIVTDSGSDLAPDVAEALGVPVVPLSIRFGSTEYTDRVDLSPEKFYAEMEAQEQLPETAAPSPGSFAEAFQSLIADGATSIISITLSEALSATAQAARTAATTIDGVPIHIVDSASVTVGQGTLVTRAAEAARDGASVEDILASTTDLSNRTHVLGVLDTLDNLKKGGRIGNAQAMIGSLLSIKPCIDLSTGSVEEAGRQRTRKKALAWLANEIPKNATNVALGHGLAPDIDKVVEMLDVEVDRISLIGPVVGTHGGPRVIGASYTVWPTPDQAIVVVIPVRQDRGMNSQAIALLIGAGGLALGAARLVISILSYRLDASRNEQPDRNERDQRLHDAA